MGYISVFFCSRCWSRPMLSPWSSFLPDFNGIDVKKAFSYARQLRNNRNDFDIHGGNFVFMFRTRGIGMCQYVPLFFIVVWGLVYTCIGKYHYISRLFNMHLCVSMSWNDIVCPFISWWKWVSYSELFHMGGWETSSSLGCSHYYWWVRLRYCFICLLLCGICNRVWEYNMQYFFAN